MTKILLLEDEANIRSFVKINLERQGYEVLEAVNGKEALELLGVNGIHIDLAILDVMLPDMSGFDVLERIRETDSDIGVIMLTAKSQQKDKITGLSRGADDYITKPFDLSELILRVGSLLKRVVTTQNEDEEASISLSENKRLLLVNGEKISITQTEYDILALLMAHKTKALQKNEILDCVWGINYFGNPNTVDVNISRIRKKILKAGGNTECIKTVWGYGYKWEENYV